MDGDMSMSRIPQSPTQRKVDSVEEDSIIMGTRRQRRSVASKRKKIYVFLQTKGLQVLTEIICFYQNATRITCVQSRFHKIFVIEKLPFFWLPSNVLFLVLFMLIFCSFTKKILYNLFIKNSVQSTIYPRTALNQLMFSLLPNYSCQTTRT